MFQVTNQRLSITLSNMGGCSGESRHGAQNGKHAMDYNVVMRALSKRPDDARNDISRNRRPAQKNINRRK